MARSPLARFLPGHLGPVKSASLRVAGRIVNNLRAGYPVRGFDEIAVCRVVFLCTPDDAVPAVVAEMAAWAPGWAGKTVALCDSTLDSDDLAPLTERGAAVASLNELPDSAGAGFVLEGDPAAVRAVRRFIAHRAVRVFELRRGAKPLFFAGFSFSNDLFTPLAYAAVSSFQLAGLDGSQALQVMQRTVERALRSYLTSGRKGWTGPVAAADAGQLQRQLAALRRHNPLLADYLRRSAELATALLGRSPDWLHAV